LSTDFQNCGSSPFGLIIGIDYGREIRGSERICLSFDQMMDTVCIFCGLSEQDFPDSYTATLKEWGDNSEFIHEGCLLWSDEFNVDEDLSAEKHIEYNPDHLPRLIDVSKSQICCFCKKPGATIAPFPSRNGRFHYPCAYQRDFDMRTGHPGREHYDKRRIAIGPDSLDELAGLARS
jgi:hypothetical protein